MSVERRSDNRQRASFINLGDLARELSAAQDDPFIFDGDIVNEQGNSKSANMPEVSKAKTGFQRHEGKSLDRNAWELATFGDPEQGQGKRKRAKPVNHGPRTRAYMESRGYDVVKLEKMVVLPSGFAFKCDYLGLWDFEGNKPGHPRLLVQVCGKSGLSEHRRKLCSDEKAWDNKRPRLTNLRFCLSQGWTCVLLAWEKEDSGRYKPIYEVITEETIEKVLERRRKSA